ncbi:hypothetical protein C8Q80DRAFT_607350 [Daedaleopsis nitida]|nr:hypothetical protein C8Q80DRAFT_607350 [Daedaleopsis nitida]
MENCLVPIEVCERVIDACYQPENLRGWRTRVVTSSYFTWQQTALVCSAWLARSRLNLLHEVVLCSTTQVDLLIRTLLDDVPAGNSTGHRLADVVVCMTVHAWDAYVPFTRMPLQSMLCKCVTYNLAEIGWRDHYPLRLIDAFMSSLWGKGIISLQISLERGLLFAVMHLIWALPMLQDLELHSSYKTLTFSALPRTPSTAACQNLRRLVIWKCIDLIPASCVRPFDPGPVPVHRRAAGIFR